MNDCRFGQPYSLFHSLDLDWILNEVKSLREEGLTLTAIRDELRALVGSDSETAKNSDALGGAPAAEYLKKTETAANSEKLGGRSSAEYLTDTEASSTYLTKTSAANTYLTPSAANQIFLPKAGTATDSNKLGGLPATAYLTETEADSKYAPIGAGAVAPPVGSILIFTNNTDPASIYADSEWTLLDSGRFLMQAGSGVALGATGGEAVHTLTVEEMPSHTHAVGGSQQGDDGSGALYFGSYFNASTSVAEEGTYHWYSVSRTSGGGTAHNNLPPYIAVNIWERTA